MAMVVEDGTGVAGANSMVTIDESNEYFLTRNPAWADIDDEDKERGLIRACDYLSDETIFPFYGIKTYGYAQTQPWPRTGAVDKYAGDIPSNVIPFRVKNAACELAIVVTSGIDLSPALPRGGGIKSKKVGPLETVYMDGAQAGTRYTKAIGILAPILRPEATGQCDDALTPLYSVPVDETGFRVGMHDYPGEM